MRMMRGFLSQAVLLTAALTAVIVIDNRSMAATAAADAATHYSWESEMNITTHGSCVGLRCLVADNVKADLFMDQHDQLRRMLAGNTNSITLPTKIGNLPAVACPPGQTYSNCINKGLEQCKTSPYLRTPPGSTKCSG